MQNNMQMVDKNITNNLNKKSLVWATVFIW